MRQLLQTCSPFCGYGRFLYLLRNLAIMRKLLYLISLILLTPCIYAQENTDVLDQIIADFENYSVLPREVVYVHLNKSVYIKGEDVGFKAYVLDKDHKRPSSETRNLYCVLTDSSNRVLKSSMLRIENGVGHGLMELDSLFHTGQYTFRAYTNWMRNFSEANHFEQPLDVLDPESDSFVRLTERAPGVDVQVLPEGGHAVAGIPSVYGIIIKDASGYGIPGVEGTITDADGKEVTRFKVNQFGIGRLRLTPREGEAYTVRFSYLGSLVTMTIPPPDPVGVTVEISDLKEQVGLTFRTRFEDPSQTRALYFLTFHNGDSIRGVPVDLGRAGEVIKIIPDSDLFTGMNVFTLFDPAGEPLLERLYFHADGLTFHTEINTCAQGKGDSLQIWLEVPGLDPDRFHSLSVSVLPENSKANRGHHNLPSYTLLQPYVKGPIENASYYFRAVTTRKQYELDNLLLTQGWSSYSWQFVRNQPPKYLFDFEKGLSYTVHFNSRNSDSFYVFPTENNPSQLLELTSDGPGDSFKVEEFYPMEGEKLGITEIRSNGRTAPSGAFVQFKPSAIPSWQGLHASLLPSRLGQTLGAIEIPPVSFENLGRLQELDEVVLIKNRHKERLEKIRDRSRGRVDIFDEDDPRRGQLLSDYLWRQGFNFNGRRIPRDQRGVGITRGVPVFFTNSSPAIFLDGVRIWPGYGTFVWQYRLDKVDYIEFDWSYGVAFPNDGPGRTEVIRIFTDPSISAQNRKLLRPFNAYSVPLAFDREKRFYSPLYGSYTSEFYQAFGVIDWWPDLKTWKEEGLSFIIENPSGGNLELHIEGIINGGEFVSGKVAVKNSSYNVFRKVN